MLTAEERIQLIEDALEKLSSDNFEQAYITMKNVIIGMKALPGEEDECSSLNTIEREIFRVSAKGIITEWRAQWWKLKQEEATEFEEALSLSKQIKMHCNEVLSFINEHFTPYILPSDIPNILFSFLIKADFSRYITEVSSGSDLWEPAENARASYESALAVTPEFPHHPMSLALTLHTGVYYRDILRAYDKGFEVVKNGLEIAESYNMEELNQDDEVLANHLTEIMKSNMDEWTIMDSNFTDSQVLTRCKSWGYLPCFFFEEIDSNETQSNKNES